MKEKRKEEQNKREQNLKIFEKKLSNEVCVDVYKKKDRFLNKRRKKDEICFRRW